MDSVASACGAAMPSVTSRMRRDWFNSVTKRIALTVTHGGTMRALMVVLGVAASEAESCRTNPDRARRGLRVSRRRYAEI